MRRHAFLVALLLVLTTMAVAQPAAAHSETGVIQATVSTTSSGAMLSGTGTAFTLAPGHGGAIDAVLSALPCGALSGTGTGSFGLHGTITFSWVSVPGLMTITGSAHGSGPFAATLQMSCGTTMAAAVGPYTI